MKLFAVRESRRDHPVNWHKNLPGCKLNNKFRSEPGSRSDSTKSNGEGKSELHMAAGSDVYVVGYWRRGDPTESATENIPPREIMMFPAEVIQIGSIFSRGKGEKVGQEPTVLDGDIGVHGKPPAEQDQIREKLLDGFLSVPDANRPGSSDSRVGRLDKWLPLLRYKRRKDRIRLIGSLQKFY